MPKREISDQGFLPTEVTVQTMFDAFITPPSECEANAQALYEEDIPYYVTDDYRYDQQIIDDRNADLWIGVCIVCANYRVTFTDENVLKVVNTLFPTATMKDVMDTVSWFDVPTMRASGFDPSDEFMTAIRQSLRIIIPIAWMMCQIETFDVNFSQIVSAGSLYPLRSVELNYREGYPIGVCTLSIPKEQKCLMHKSEFPVADDLTKHSTIISKPVRVRHKIVYGDLQGDYVETRVATEKLTRYQLVELPIVLMDIPKEVKPKITSQQRTCKIDDSFTVSDEDTENYSRPAVVSGFNMICQKRYLPFAPLLAVFIPSIGPMLVITWPKYQEVYQFASLIGQLDSCILATRDNFDRFEMPKLKCGDEFISTVKVVDLVREYILDPDRYRRTLLTNKRHTSFQSLGIFLSEMGKSAP